MLKLDLGRGKERFHTELFLTLSLPDLMRLQADRTPQLVHTPSYCSYPLNCLVCQPDASKSAGELTADPDEAEPTAEPDVARVGHGNHGR